MQQSEREWETGWLHSPHTHKRLYIDTDTLALLNIQTSRTEIPHTCSVHSELNKTIHSYTVYTCDHAKHDIASSCAYVAGRHFHWSATHMPTLSSQRWKIFTPSSSNSWFLFLPCVPVFLTLMCYLFSLSRLLCLMSPLHSFSLSKSDRLHTTWDPSLGWATMVLFVSALIFSNCRNQPSWWAGTHRGSDTHLPDFNCSTSISMQACSCEMEYRVTSGTLHLHHTDLCCANT